eukprot:2830994-Pyramimonas_sp.AAC.1
MHHLCSEREGESERERESAKERERERLTYRQQHQVRMGAARRSCRIRCTTQGSSMQHLWPEQTVTEGEPSEGRAQGGHIDLDLAIRPERSAMPGRGGL